MAVSRHLGYYRTRNSAIRSADPENLTLEANITSIGKTVAKLWPFLYIQDVFVLSWFAEIEHCAQGRLSPQQN